ncbi:hypothetical protein V8E36_008541 [Tilletia maclaganii]
MLRPLAASSIPPFGTSATFAALAALFARRSTHAGDLSYTIHPTAYAARAPPSRCLRRAQLFPHRQRLHSHSEQGATWRWV